MWLFSCPCTVINTSLNYITSCLIKHISTVLLLDEHFIVLITSFIWSQLMWLFLLLPATAIFPHRNRQSFLLKILPENSLGNFFSVFHKQTPSHAKNQQENTICKFLSCITVTKKVIGRNMKLQTKQHRAWDNVQIIWALNVSITHVNSDDLVSLLSYFLELESPLGCWCQRCKENTPSANNVVN